MEKAEPGESFDHILGVTGYNAVKEPKRCLVIIERPFTRLVYDKLAGIHKEGSLAWRDPQPVTQRGISAP